MPARIGPGDRAGQGVGLRTGLDRLHKAPTTLGCSPQLVSARLPTSSLFSVTPFSFRAFSRRSQSAHSQVCEASQSFGSLCSARCCDFIFYLFHGIFLFCRFSSRSAVFVVVVFFFDVGFHLGWNLGRGR